MTVSIVRDKNLDILFINGGMLRMPFWDEKILPLSWHNA